MAGLISSITRSLKQFLKNFRKRFSGRKKKRGEAEEPIVVPRSWVNENPGLQSKGVPENSRLLIQQEGKKRIPGLLKIKRLLAGVLLLFNFVFSQFLLAATGVQGIFTFLFFMGNSFIMADYLWKTRRKDK